MKQKFEIVKNFKIFAIISAIFCITGLAGIVLLPFGVNLFNLSIDFAGGTSMQFAVKQEVTSEVKADIQKLFEDATGVKPSYVQDASDGTEVIIKSIDINTEQRQAVIKAMEEKYAITDDDVLSVENVNASVSSDLRNSALIAAIIAALLMMVYITIRFEFTSGVAAVICLLHDLLVMLSAYIIFQIPLSSSFIAAALTILGYSINASIIVFDRIRENMKFTRREKFAEVCEKSIWQTLARTINTTITTLIMITLIYIMGVTSIKEFTLPLIIGVVSGAYSSIFLSGSIWNKLKSLQKKSKQTKKA